MELRYETRDGEGNDIVKMVQIKEYEAKDTEFDCPICKGHFEKGIPAKKIVSASFVDWAVCKGLEDLDRDKKKR